jgi:hypothetical protein
VSTAARGGLPAGRPPPARADPARVGAWRAGRIRWPSRAAGGTRWPGRRSCAADRWLSCSWTPRWSCSVARGRAGGPRRPLRPPQLPALARAGRRGRLPRVRLSRVELRRRRAVRACPRAVWGHDPVGRHPAGRGARRRRLGSWRPASRATVSLEGVDVALQAAQRAMAAQGLDEVTFSPASARCVRRLWRSLCRVGPPEAALTPPEADSAPLGTWDRTDGPG